MKTDNQIISDARGECRHVRYDYINTMCGGSGKCLDCGHLFDSLSLLKYDSAQYDSDLEAWDADLTKWIEDNELMENMQYWLYAVINDEQTIMCKGHSIMIGSVTMGRIINATPAQKAQALAQAIKERAQ